MVSSYMKLSKKGLPNVLVSEERTTFLLPEIISGDLGGTILVPGIYKTSSTLFIKSGDLTLDALGDANAVWIFKTDFDLITIGGTGGNIVITGGAKPDNIFWQIGNSATIGEGTSFVGNISARKSITLNHGARVMGRMSARDFSG